MKSKSFALMLVAAVMLVYGVAEAAEVTLNQVTFPERNQIGIDFVSDQRAPEATMTAEVEYGEGQAEMNIQYKEMKPAILIGGDVTCYVLWAVTRDGTVENMGELWVRDDSEKVEYSTGQKSFAMMVTAESHPLVTVPSELVMFRSLAAKTKNAPSESFTFSGFGPAPRIEYPSVAHVTWDRTQPLDLRQAQKAYELAVNAGAETYAPTQLFRARTMLAQATGFSAANKEKATVDYSRRSLSLSAEALQVTARRKEAEAVEAEIVRRTAEMEALTTRAGEAEASAAAAAAALAEANRAIEKVQRSRTEAEAAVLASQGELARRTAEIEVLTTQASEAETASAVAAAAALVEANRAIDEVQRSRAEAESAVLAAQGELARIEAERAALAVSVSALEEQSAALKGEKAELSARLQGALSQVADTKDSARGMIVSLPDILFDLNEATLKNEAKIVIAKLAGIFLILPELNLRVEGHTDSTGSADYNQGLSERRAVSVRDFLAQQDIGGQRMVAVGYGLTRPVADNSSSAGRASNRRVEIVIAQGVISAE
jgi:outer membrane protein OmpA-like peptidoglycan-associated protein